MDPCMRSSCCRVTLPITSSLALLRNLRDWVNSGRQFRKEMPNKYDEAEETGKFLTCKVHWTWAQASMKIHSCVWCCVRIRLLWKNGSSVLIYNCHQMTLFVIVAKKLSTYWKRREHPVLLTNTWRGQPIFEIHTIYVMVKWDGVIPVSYVLEAAGSLYFPSLVNSYLKRRNCDVQNPQTSRMAVTKHEKKLNGS